MTLGGKLDSLFYLYIISDIQSPVSYIYISNIIYRESFKYIVRLVIREKSGFTYVQKVIPQIWKCINKLYTIYYLQLTYEHPLRWRLHEGPTAKYSACQNTKYSKLASQTNDSVMLAAMMGMLLFAVPGIYITR